MPTEPIRPIEGVCEVETIAVAGADPASPPDLLLEVPHGATRPEQFHATRAVLRGEIPEDLIDFFFVNTDVGSPECARIVAEIVTRPEEFPILGDLLGAERLSAVRRVAPRKVMIVRSLIPRTFVDCNRIIEHHRDDDPTLTPGIAPWVSESGDVEALERLYRQYQDVAERAYDLACGAGGSAIIVHTYAPKSVRVERFDRDIARRIREAYEPEVYERWPTRPDVDIISESEEGERLASLDLVVELQRHFVRIGVQATENVTYRLYPTTWAHRHSIAYPGKVLCIELNRARLAAPFSPFEEMRIGEDDVVRMSAPIAAAWLTVRAGSPAAETG